MLKCGGHQKSHDVFIPGQLFHMDLSFVSGSLNLEDMITSNASPKGTFKQSCDGNISFLTIINLATRNL